MLFAVFLRHVKPPQDINPTKIYGSHSKNLPTSKVLTTRGTAWCKPIHPCRLAAITGCSEDVVINELRRNKSWPNAHALGARMRSLWQVSATDTLGTLPRCGLLGMWKKIASTPHKIMVTFTFSPDVLYGQQLCLHTQPKINGFNAAFAPMAATNSGSGFRTPWEQERESFVALLPPDDTECIALSQ